MAFFILGLRCGSLLALSLALVACGSSGTGTTSTSSGAGGESTGGMAGSGGTAGAAGMGGSGGGGGSMAVGCPGLDPIVEPKETLYVAPNGDDMATGSKDAPLATLEEAAKRFPMGGTIIVRGGTYAHQVLTNPTGTVDHPLVIRAETGETPIFDGANQTMDYRGTLHLASPTNVVLMGLEVRNATGSNYAAGISNGGRVNNLRVRDCHLHHINGPVARFSGEGIFFEGNDVHDGVLINSMNQPMQGWPTCMGTQPDKNTPADPWAKNIVVRKNHIRDCWGEGIALFFGTDGVVEDNIVERTWGAGIYIDNGSDVIVSRNYVHMVAGMSVGGGAPRPIVLGLENYDQWGVSYKPMLNITIINNVAIGLNGMRFFSEPSTSPNFYYDNLTVAHNTFIAEGPALRMNPVEMGKQLPTKVSIHNNVMVEGTASTVPYPAIFDLAGNAWLNEALPPAAGPTDVSIMNVSLPANVTAATDLQALAETVGSADKAAGVPSDYLCAPRSATTPTRGAFEK